MSSLNETEESKLRCNHCRQPPRQGTKLKRCSRCHFAWYHDAQCQRNDYPKHKIICRQQQKNLSPQRTIFDVQAREGRGKCLVAHSLIRQKTRIFDHWKPFVPPALHEEYRTSRCALCFNEIQHEPVCYDKTPRNPLYTLFFCSDSCRDVAARRYDMDQEEFAIHSLWKGSTNSPPKIFSTAILVYRLLLAQKDISIKNQMKELQSQPRRDIYHPTYALYDQEDEFSQRHTEGVVATVMGMIQNSDVSRLRSLQFHSNDHLVNMVYQVKINGFSICDGEFVCYGIGVYSTPSFMNHSCRANAMQTFLFQQTNLPRLNVTAYVDIAPNQEVCISYTDSSCPTHLRQQRLFQDYFFNCTCQACKNYQMDAIKMGIKCPKCLASRFVQVATHFRPSPTQPQYQCEGCKSTNFDPTMQKLNAFESQQRELSTKKSKSLQETYQWHEQVKRICYMDSWYVQEAGENLLKALLNDLTKHIGNPVGEQEVAWKALKLSDELLGGWKRQTEKLNGIGSDVDTSSFMKMQHLKYKAAKLRLFLIPDPRQAIQELQDVLKELLPFYTKDHELIKGLQDCLSNAMM